MTKTETETTASFGLDNLKHALKVTGAARSKGTIPILSCVRVEQIGSGLAVEQTDLDVYVRVVLPEMAGPAQPILTPADKFNAWASLLDGESMTLSAKEHRATVRCGRAKATLPLFPASSWPSTEVYELKANAVTLTQGPLARALSFAHIAISKEESRYTLNAALLQSDGGRLSVVATDGHRLMLYTIPCDDNLELLLPARAIKALLPLLPDEAGGAVLAHDEHWILATIDSAAKTQIGSKKMSGSFPNWHAVIPKDPRVEVKLQVAGVISSLGRAALMADETSGAVDLTFSDGKLAIHAASSEHGEADESIGYDGALKNPFKTRVNVDYLRDLLHKLSGEVIVAVPEDNQRPLVFKAEPHKGETLTYVVMPMRM